jgi:hypothetical protein
MLRLTLMLSCAIYAGLVIYSQEVTDMPGADIGVSRTGTAVDLGAPAPLEEADRLVTADGRVLVMAAVIDPMALDDGTDRVALVATARREAVTSSTSGGVAELPLVEVTGGFVNLRAGPSTGDAVLGALSRGERAELIAATGDGWVQIRAVETGVEGFMAERFVTLLN